MHSFNPLSSSTQEMTYCNGLSAALSAAQGLGYNSAFPPIAFPKRSAIMRKCIIVLLTVVVLLGAALGQTASQPQTAPAPKFDINNIDKSLDPCVDFYKFACSKWMKNNPAPPEYPDWVSFSEVYEHNLGILRSILDKYSANDPQRSPINRKIGDFYASYTDESAVNKAGYSPLKPELDRIAAVKDKTQMIEVMAHEQLVG